MKAFDSIWEEIHANNEWGKYPSEHIIRFVARNFYRVVNRKEVKMLDFGCGGGAHTWYLSREGFSTYAFDGSKVAIKKLSEYLDAEGLDADLKVLDGVNLDYEDSFFDGVIDNVCIYANKIEDIKKMYREVYRVLKKEGKFITAVFSTETDGFNDGDEIEHHTFVDIKSGRLQGRGTTHFFDKREIKTIIEETGFRDLIIDKIDYTDLGDTVGMFIVMATK